MAVIACYNCNIETDAPDELVGLELACFSCGESVVVCSANEVLSPNPVSPQRNESFITPEQEMEIVTHLFLQDFF